MRYIFLLLLFIYNSSCEKPDSSDQTTDVLFIGSSYFLPFDMTGLFQEIADSLGEEVYIDECIEPGLYLADHAISLTTELKILEKDWDFVILQAAGTVTAYPDSFPRKILDALETLQRKITLNCRKTKTVFCMPWAFEDGMAWKEGWTDTFADMQLKIYDNTLIYSDQVGFIISPVGWAWYHVLEEKDYPLHYLHLSDWNHPSPKGSYLMACTIFSTVFKTSTVGIPVYWGLLEEDALYFQGVASDIVLDDLDLWNVP